MRVLIVDGYSSGQWGREAFKDFRYAIEKCLQKPYYQYLTDVGIAIRDVRHLHDVIFDQNNHNTPYQNPDSMKLFRAMDLVFIGGNDTTLTPWGPQNYALRLLLSQAVTLRKPCFVSGSPIHLLTYMVGLRNRQIRVFNGRGKGGPLKDLHQLPDHINKSLTEHDCFLDASTGDLYAKEHLGAFKPVGNVGTFNPLIGNSRATSSNTGLYQQPHPQKTHSMEPFTSRNNEALVEISSVRYSHHWMLRNLPKRFVIQSNNVWRIGPKLDQQFATYLTNVTTKQPQMISLGDVLMCADFQVVPKYPETITLLDNWITYVCDFVRSNPGRPLGLISQEIFEDPSTTKNPISDLWQTKLKEEGKRRKDEGKRQFKESVKGPTKEDTERARFKSEMEQLQREADEINAKLEFEKHSSLNASATLGANWTIKRGLNSTEIDVGSQRVFNKVEIRKMLHPEINIADIAPYVPEKVVRISATKRPYTRWKYFQTEIPTTRPQSVPAPGPRPRSYDPSNKTLPTMRRPTTENGARLMTPFKTANRRTTTEDII